MSPSRRRTLLWLLPVALLDGLGPAGCAAKRPVLYPNDYYQDVGPEIAESEVSRCVSAAREYARANRAGQVAGEVAESSVAGGAAGAAAGVITGGAGKGAAAGAAAAGSWSLVRGLFRTRDPDPVEARFVEKCLRDRGFEPIGWR
jgi:hypothetical protein